jgi:inorganic pyrophosphatase
MEVQVIVEIPQGSRNKYEMDHVRGPHLGHENR